MHATKFLSAVAALAALTACGGGSGTGTGTGGAGISGGVIKGPVTGASVCVYQIDAGAKGALVPVTLAAGASGAISAGCYVTASDGSYDFQLPAGTAGDLLIEATGGTFCSNEEQIADGACPNGGTVIDLGTSVLTSAIAAPSTGTATIYTTPLTTAAVNAAAGASFTAATFDSQFTTLAGQIIGAGSGVTPATAPTAANQPYLAQVASFMQGGGSLNNAVGSLQQGSTTFSSGSNGNTSPATVHAGVVGNYALTFHAEGVGCGTVCSYTDGQEVAVTVHSDGRLELPAKTLTNPFHRNFGSGPHTPEIIWLDPEENVEYALSDNNTGNFNEINIGDASRPSGSHGMPTFIGQLRAPSNNNLTVISEFVGTHALGYQYRGTDVDWTAVTVSADGAITFTGGSGPDITGADIVAVHDRLGCCDRVDLQLGVDLDGDGLDAQDKISLYRATDGGLRSIEYSLVDSSSPADGVGVQVGAVAPLASHSGVQAPSVNAIHGTLNGTEMNFAAEQASVMTQTFALEAEGGDGIAPLWNIRITPGAPIVQGMAYSCRRQPGSEIIIRVRTTTSGPLLATSDGGRCEITITKYVVGSGSSPSEVEGYFVAEFLDSAQDGPLLSVQNGTFRYLTP